MRYRRNPNHIPSARIGARLAQGGMRKSILTIHAEAAKQRNTSGRQDWQNFKRESLEALTRDTLRGVCKHRGVKGYGKMNKAQLVEAALR